MLQVKADVVRNLLRLTYAQRVTVAQVKEGHIEIEAALAKLQPGFRILTDLSGLEEMDYACADEIRSFMELVRGKGVSEVVRVIPEPSKDIGFTLMSYFHYGHDVPFLTCETLEEAEKKLSS